LRHCLRIRWLKSESPPALDNSNVGSHTVVARQEPLPRCWGRDAGTLPGPGSPCPLRARWVSWTRGFTVTGGEAKAHADLRRDLSGLSAALIPKLDSASSILVTRSTSPARPGAYSFLSITQNRLPSGASSTLKSESSVYPSQFSTSRAPSPTSRSTLSGRPRTGRGARGGDLAPVSR